MKQGCKIAIISVCAVLFSLSLSAQVVKKAPNMSSGVSTQTISNATLKGNCHLLSVGVDDFQNIQSLNSSSNLDGIKFAADNILPLSYYHVRSTFLHKKVDSNEILAELNKMVNVVSSSSVVIIILASHGEVINGEYYFVTSDTDRRNLAQTAVSGTVLRDKFDRMASKGARVMVFIDTCHAAALYGDGYNGPVYYCASSDVDESALEIEKKSQFSIKLGEILSSSLPVTNNSGYITWAGMLKQLQAAVETVGQTHGQTFKFYQQSAKDFPVLKYKEVKRSKFYSSSLLPWKVSDTNPGLDYAMIAVECGSAVSLLTCGLLQGHYKNLIIENDKAGYSTDSYKQSGRNCAIGCCVSAGVLLTSYLVRTLHVNKEYYLKFSGKKVASLNFAPAMTNEYAGMSFALNF